MTFLLFGDQEGNHEVGPKPVYCVYVYFSIALIASVVWNLFKQMLLVYHIKIYLTMSVKEDGDGQVTCTSIAFHFYKNSDNITIVMQHTWECEWHIFNTSTEAGVEERLGRFGHFQTFTLEYEYKDSFLRCRQVITKWSMIVSEAKLKWGSEYIQLV